MSRVAVRVAGSFRDPAGYMFSVGDELYRAVTDVGLDDLELLESSGLYDNLVSAGMLVSHEDCDLSLVSADHGSVAEVRRVIRPDLVPYVSYPYEWTFSQLQDAALLTLDVCLRALDRNMVLRDASAYNIQFVGCSPVFIDTLSFKRYEPGSPWVAYRQFCQHFLCPLAVISKVDVGLGRILRGYVDGMPLSMASHLLPARTRLNLGLLAHVHLHAQAQSRYSQDSERARKTMLPKSSLVALLLNLRSTVSRLSWGAGGTEWAKYYGATNYSDDAMGAKREIVRDMVGSVSPTMTWDLGANTGSFSDIAAEHGSYVVAFDIDPSAVETGYLSGRKAGNRLRLPLLLDLMNPSPNIGWALRERDAWVDRGRPDLVLALALVHHLAIGNNLPLPDVAAFFAGIAPSLVIEFVPKEDDQTQKLLAARRDIFPSYRIEGFLSAFGRFFEVAAKVHVPGTLRTVFLMHRKAQPQ